MILIVLLYALLASTFTLAKASLLYAKPVFLIGIRMLIAGALLLGSIRLFGRGQWQLAARRIPFYMLLALVHIYGAYVPEFWALQYISSCKSCLFYNFSPFITALFAYLIYKKALSARQMTGLVVGMFGIIPLVFTEWQSGSCAWAGLPDLAMLSAVCCSAAGWVLIQHGVTTYGYSPIMLNGIAMIGGGLAALATSLVIESVPRLILPTPGDVWWFCVYLGALIFVANVVFYNFYGFLLKRYSATLLAFAGFTCPLFAALFGWFFLAESISMLFVASAVITSVGLFIFYSGELGGTKAAVS